MSRIHWYWQLDNHNMQETVQSERAAVAHGTLLAYSCLLQWLCSCNLSLMSQTLVYNLAAQAHMLMQFELCDR